jgi:hypothetical protein
MDIVASVKRKAKVRPSSDRSLLPISMKYYMIVQEKNENYMTYQKKKWELNETILIISKKSKLDVASYHAAYM